MKVPCLPTGRHHTIKINYYMMKLWKYIIGTLIRPIKTFEEIRQDENAMKYSFITMLIWCILYGLISMQLYFKGETPWSTWINIPIKQYYLWESIFLPPLNLLLWVLFSALIYLFSYRKNAKGTFEQTFSLIGFAWSIPAFFMFLLPDFIIMTFFNKHIFNLLIPLYGSLYFVWMIFLCALGLKSVREISLFKSLLICLIAFIIHFPIGFTFIR